MAEIDLPRALDVARRAAEAAGRAALAHFRIDVRTRTKADRSPVTQADLEAEAAAIEIIRETFPDHALLTEESGALAGTADNRWIVDPLDGTRGFTRGGVFWGPLIALEHKGEIVAGAMGMPALGQSWWAARGLGAWRDGTRLRIAPVADWSEATLSVGELSRLANVPAAAGLPELIRTCASARAFGDVAGVAMLLDGRADAWVEGGVQYWDLAPSQILVEEAGGRFTDFDGHPTPANGTAFAAHPEIHGRLLAMLRGNASGNAAEGVERVDH